MQAEGLHRWMLQCLQHWVRPAHPTNPRSTLTNTQVHRTTPHESSPQRFYCASRESGFPPPIARRPPTRSHPGSAGAPRPVPQSTAAPTPPGVRPGVSVIWTVWQKLVHGPGADWVTVDTRIHGKPECLRGPRNSRGGGETRRKKQGDRQGVLPHLVMQSTASPTGGGLRPPIRRSHSTIPSPLPPPFFLRASASPCDPLFRSACLQAPSPHQIWRWWTGSWI